MTEPPPQALPVEGWRPTLAVRAGAIALLLLGEKILLNFLVDFDAAQAAHGLGAAVREAQHWGFRFLVTMGAALALFGYVRQDARLAPISRAVRAAPLRLRWLLLHAALLLPLAPLSYSLFGGRGLELPLALIVALWLLFAAGAVLAAFAALAPWALWRRAAAALGMLWLYAAIAAITAAAAMQWSQQLWEPTARLTFELVQRVLSPLVPSLQGDPRTLILSTDRFAVEVSAICSGLEGVGLMLAFVGAWLLYFRREYVFPRSLLLIPAGALLIFGLNVLRIAALVLIGHYGSREVAVYGFHSQAGWFAFNLAAGGVVLVSRRSPWLNRAAVPAAAGSRNPTAAYLLPFLAILAAGIVARAVSSGFETFYALRLAAAAWMLRRYWPQFAALDWRISLRGPLAGVAVFALWMLAARLLTAPGSMPAPLADMTPAWRLLWLAGRAATAVVAAPIAEELAYRGYLMRRLQQADFEAVRFAAVGARAWLLSALAFGIAHGTLWLPGIAAGLIYGALLIRTGRIGEAVAAHATTNALLAASVLLGGQWQLW